MSYKPVSYSGFSPVGVPYNPANYVNFLATADDKLIPVGMETLAVTTGTTAYPTASKYNVSGVLADTAMITLESGTARFSVLGDNVPLTQTNGVKLQVSMSGTNFMQVRTTISNLRFIASEYNTTINLHYFKVGKGGHS